MVNYTFEENNYYFDTLDIFLSLENNGWPSIRFVSNDLNELLEFYKDYPENKIPMFIAAIRYGLANNLTIPTVFNLETTVPQHRRFTDEFDVFYTTWCDGKI